MTQEVNQVLTYQHWWHYHPYHDDHDPYYYHDDDHHDIHDPYDYHYDHYHHNDHHDDDHDHAPGEQLSGPAERSLPHIGVEPEEEQLLQQLLQRGDHYTFLYLKMLESRSKDALIQ